MIWMKTTDTDSLKFRAKELGADLCGVASVDRFSHAPAGFHPTDILPNAQSVFVVAARFPTSTLSGSSQAAYTFVRNRLVSKVDSITFQLAVELESQGSCAIPIPSSDPYDFWDPDRRHGQGILSLKHASVLAGLGQMGKNTLLVNKQFGNMLWLGAVITDAKLDADPLADFQPCSADCRICLTSCPAQALNGISIEQKKCRSISGKSSEGGGMVYACNLCRKLCPNCQGVK
jgi:epoxyqueuosine reductase